MINMNSGWFSGALLIFVAGILVTVVATSLHSYDRSDRRAWVLAIGAAGLFTMAGFLASYAVTV